MAEFKKYLDITALSTLVDQIKAEDTKAIAAAQKYTDDSLKLYEKAGSAATAESNAKAYTDQLANGAVSTNIAAITKLNANAETEGSVDYKIAQSKVAIDADIKAVDDKAVKNASDISAINNAESGILAQAKGYTDDAVAEVQQNLDNLDAYVGDIPEGYSETNVVDYVNKKASEVLSQATGGSSESAASVKSALDAYIAENNPKVAANATAAQNAKDAADAAQASADSTQEYAEGVAGDLANEIKARGDADSALDDRIATLEGQITGLTGAMHFKGVVDALPEDVSSYANGDVIVVGEKEYVFNGTTFVEFGDVSAEGERIAALETHKTAYEAKVATLESEMATAKSNIAEKVDKTTYEVKVEALEGADTDNLERIEALEAKFTGDASVESLIADAKAEAIQEATALAGTAETNAKNYAKGLDDAMALRVAALEGVDHSHKNLALLDTYTQTEADLADAVAKKHSHENADVLAGITSAKVQAWDASEGNAKTYADGLNTSMTSKVDGAIEKIGALETTIATKADEEDLTAAIERIAQNELDIAANLSAINSFTPITAEEVAAMFA